MDIFSLVYHFSFLSPSLWETARYSCLVGCFGFNGPLRQYFSLYRAVSQREVGWSGGAMVLGKLSVPGRPTIWITVGQGPTALAVGAGGGLFGH